MSVQIIYEFSSLDLYGNRQLIVSKAPVLLSYVTNSLSSFVVSLLSASPVEALPILVMGGGGGMGEEEMDSTRARSSSLWSWLLFLLDDLTYI
jgi:hypothetical protein